MIRFSVLAVTVLLVALIYAALHSASRTTVGDSGGGLAVAELLSGDPAGFRRVTGPRSFDFPADHGAHRGYRSEWWYFTGHLATKSRRKLGFQLTFFRFSLRPEPVVRSSRWAANDLYMAHFAVSDIDERTFISTERFSRAALGLAGADVSPYRVWLEDWVVESSGEAFFPLRLEAGSDAVHLALELEAGKPMVLQGERGYSQKSADPGNASHYYSYTRMPASGTIRVGETAPMTVTGSVWMDREWGTSALGPDQVGWDWFAIQLDDGRELMFYRLRTRSGQTDPFSAGTLVENNGDYRLLSAADVHVEPLDYWTSSLGNGRYPVRWQLSLSDPPLELEIKAAFPEQEHDLSVQYWEGAAEVAGREGSRAITGQAYVEMTGYGD